MLRLVACNLHISFFPKPEYIAALLNVKHKTSLPVASSRHPPLSCRYEVRGDSKMGSGI